MCQAVPSKVVWLSLRSAHPADARSNLLDQGECSPVGQGGGQLWKQAVPLVPGELLA